jgi:hypothetical protein
MATRRLFDGASIEIGQVPLVFVSAGTNYVVSIPSFALTLNQSTVVNRVDRKLSVANFELNLNEGNVAIKNDFNLPIQNTTLSLSERPIDLKLSYAIAIDKATILLNESNVDLKINYIYEIDKSTLLLTEFPIDIIITSLPTTFTCVYFQNGIPLLGTLRIKDGLVYKDIKGYKKVAGNYIQI